LRSFTSSPLGEISLFLELKKPSVSNIKITLQLLHSRQTGEKCSVITVLNIQAHEQDVTTSVMDVQNGNATRVERHTKKEFETGF
jgi:hypothetical protein